MNWEARAGRSLTEKAPSVRNTMRQGVGNGGRTDTSACGLGRFLLGGRRVAGNHQRDHGAYVVADGYAHLAFAVIVEAQAGVQQADMPVHRLDGHLARVDLRDALLQVLQHLLGEAVPLSRISNFRYAPSSRPVMDSLRTTFLPLKP